MIFSRINCRTLRVLRKYETIWFRWASNSSCAVASESKTSDSFSNDSNHTTTSTSYNMSERRIPINVEEYQEMKRSKPSQPENPHLLKVSILGEPNAGKSTLTNALVKWKVCAVSSKVHTTRKRAAAVFVEENKQIVFLDTPGCVTPEITKKHSLEPSFVMDPVKCIRDADLIAVVVDIANKWTNNRINENILEILETFKDKKSILVLNKADAMKSKNRILSFTKILTAGTVAGVSMSQFEETSHQKKLSLAEILQENNMRQHDEVSEPPPTEEKETKKGWPHFSRVFMVSALKNDGINDLREYLLKAAIPRDWMYHNSLITDQHPHEVALTVVREKLLEYLPQEIPYKVNLHIVKWEMLSTGCPKINIRIVCPNSRHKRFIIGPNGQHIAACADRARKAMREAFRKDVVLNLGVK